MHMHHLNAAADVKTFQNIILSVSTMVRHCRVIPVTVVYVGVATTTATLALQSMHICTNNDVIPRSTTHIHCMTQWGVAYVTLPHPIVMHIK